MPRGTILGVSNATPHDIINLKIDTTLILIEPN